MGEAVGRLLPIGRQRFNLLFLRGFRRRKSGNFIYLRVQFRAQEGTGLRIVARDRAL